MKIKTLKQQAKAADKQILKDDAAFYEKITAEQFGKKKEKKKLKIFAVTAPIGAAVLTVVLCLALLLPTRAPDSQKKYYMLSNETSVNSTPEEMNADMQELTFIAQAGYDFSYTRVYDSQYNDTLYYTVRATNGELFETIFFEVYVNPDYDRQKELSKEPQTKTVGNLTWNYSQTIEGDDIYTVKTVAKTENKNTTVYIEHEQLNFEPTGNFFNFVLLSFVLRLSVNI